MTWSHVVTNGGGPYELRLVIAGYPREWITDGMTAGAVSTGTGTGRTRCRGLLRRGLRKAERARLAEGLPDQDGCTASIVDIDAQATAEFTAVPAVRGWLTASVEPADTALTLDGPAASAASDYYHIGTEAVYLAAGPTWQRGKWDTIAQGHWVQRGDTTIAPELTDVPVMMTGRRWMLYAHGPTETGLSSTGTLVARGVVAGEPKERDGVWSIRLDPIVSVLDQEIVQPLADKLTPIGIYYPWNSPFTLRLIELVDGQNDSAQRGGTTEATITLSGYFATQEDFVTALNDELATQLAAASIAGSVYAAAEAGTWELYLATTAAGYWVRAMCSNGVDGVVSWFTVNAMTTAADVGREVLRVGASGTYRYKWTALDRQPGVYDKVPPEKLRGFPRINGYEELLEAIAETANNPRNRIYLREAQYLNVDDVLRINHGARDDGSPAVTLEYVVTAVDTTTGAVDLEGGGFATAWVGDWGPPIRAAAAVDVGGMSLAGFRDQLVADGPARGNLGDTPLLDGTDLASWTTEVDAAANGRAPLTLRVYAFPKRISLKQVLSHELRQYGLFMYTDDDEKLAVRALIPALETDADTTAITSIHRIVDDGFGTIDAVADGVINVAEMRTGWNPESEKHEGDTFVFPNAISVSRLGGRKRTLEIAPRVATAAGVVWSRSDAHEICTVPISYFGERYHVVTIPVTLHQFNRRVGDGVAIDIDQLPYNGARGIDTTGTVIGYSWDFEAGSGELEILVRDVANIAGYTPAGRVASNANVSGNTYNLTLEANRYNPTGSADASFFVAGDRVFVWRFDSSSGSSAQDGVVVSVTGNVVRVTFDAAWTPGTDTWELMYSTHGDIDANATSTGQLSYAFFADADRKLADGSPARNFSP